MADNLSLLSYKSDDVLFLKVACRRRTMLLLLTRIVPVTGEARCSNWERYKQHGRL